MRWVARKPGVRGEQPGRRGLLVNGKKGWGVWKRGAHDERGDPKGVSAQKGWGVCRQEGARKWGSGNEGSGEQGGQR